MDKYLLIIMMFLISGMIIAAVREPFELGLFYSMLAGIIIIIIYSSVKNRREHKELRRRRKSKY